MPEMEQTNSGSDIIIDVPEDLGELTEGELAGLYYSLLAFKGQHPEMDRVSRIMLEKRLL